MPECRHCAVGGTGGTERDDGVSRGLAAQVRAACELREGTGTGGGGSGRRTRGSLEAASASAPAEAETAAPAASAAAAAVPAPPPAWAGLRAVFVSRVGARDASGKADPKRTFSAQSFGEGRGNGGLVLGTLARCLFEGAITFTYCRHGEELESRGRAFGAGEGERVDGFFA